MSTRLTQARKSLSRSALIILTRMFKLAASLFPYRAAVAAGGALGRIAYYLLPRDRGRALANLSAVYPELSTPAVRDLGRRVFIHLGKALLEEMSVTPGRLRSLVSLRGVDNLRTAIAQGRGVVFVTGHIGNWELLGAAVSALHSVSVVAAPIKPKALNDMIVGLRASLGVRTILRGQPGAAKELIRVFRENRILGILIDQDTDVEGAFVDFMGRPAWTPTAAAQMAIKFGAPVVFGYLLRKPDGSHEGFIDGPLPLVRTGNDRADIAENTAVLTKMIEDAVRRTPEQWVWMHRRWRRQP